LGEPRQPEQIHLELVARLVEWCLFDTPVEAEPGTVDEDIGPP